MPCDGNGIIEAPSKNDRLKHYDRPNNVGIDFDCKFQDTYDGTYTLRPNFHQCVTGLLEVVTSQILRCS